MKLFTIKLLTTSFIFLSFSINHSAGVEGKAKALLTIPEALGQPEIKSFLPDPDIINYINAIAKNDKELHQLKMVSLSEHQAGIKLRNNSMVFLSEYLANDILDEISEFNDPNYIVSLAKYSPKLFMELIIKSSKALVKRQLANNEPNYELLYQKIQELYSKFPLDIMLNLLPKYQDSRDQAAAITLYITPFLTFSGIFNSFLLQSENNLGIGIFYSEQQNIFGELYCRARQESVSYELIENHNKMMVKFINKISHEMRIIHELIYPNFNLLNHDQIDSNVMMKKAFSKYEEMIFHLYSLSLLYSSEFNDAVKSLSNMLKISTSEGQIREEILNNMSSSINSLNIGMQSIINVFDVFKKFSTN